MIRLHRIFSKLLNDRALVMGQIPIRLKVGLQPEPDLSIFKPCGDDYIESDIQIQDVYLLIEISDTTIDHDRNVKSVLYGRAGIIELWIVDVSAELIEVYHNPGANGYESIQQFRRGESISPLSFTVTFWKHNEEFSR